jgi:hypothetical protein
VSFERRKIVRTLSRLGAGITIAVLLFALAWGSAFCAPGDLDPTFGTGGKLLVPHGRAIAVAVDTTLGRITAAGGRNDHALLISAGIGL